ncbi:hypothetical protein [Bacillus sp. P14.5]|uniref:hypothetical protein n=1 Tax=Bacillus sp. P14.5 TaxID=1983400 RepID=UPI000DEAECCB|nr:hypothetical protein [Bacillus sp. P14.5]
MNISTGMFLMMTASHLIQVSLLMAIFSSIYLKSKRNGYFSLVFIFVLYWFQLFRGFSISYVLGISFLIIIIAMGIVSFFVIRRKKDSRN